jgi:hypothetical protein
MKNALLVPIHLDALVLKNDRTVIEPMADFTRLPYSDGKRTFNPDIANISEEILSQPFQDLGFQLKPGVHLHWALPDGLTKGVGQAARDNAKHKQKVAFPVVPNRWLVTRTDKAGQKKQWIVESDYLYPPGQGAQSSGISYPYSKNGQNTQPFRSMGRAMPLAAWKNRDDAPPAQYLNQEQSAYPLTAVGYGEPTFAAFYPNCHSVFGFYDDYDNEALPDLNGVQYDVMGWYDNPAQDCLGITALRENEDKYQALKEHYRWSVDQTDGAFPEQTVCYACLTFKVNPSLQPINNLTETKEVDVAVGNTSTEALSAYLAYRIIHQEAQLDSTLSEADLQKACSQLEDQLEALHIVDGLEGRKLDIGFKFKEARHEKEFTAVSGGKIWTIRPENGANANDSADRAHVAFPEDLAHLLNQLNIQQQAYDRDCDEIESMQKQLFADWYKYMMCDYPPGDRRDDYPNVDQVKYFIEKNSLLPLQRRMTRNKALGIQCQAAVNHLKGKVSGLVFPQIPKNTHYVLQPIPAPRYWLPNEPVVLIADEIATPTPRHGQDGRLHDAGLLDCQILPLEDSTDKEFIHSLSRMIERLNPPIFTSIEVSAKDQLNRGELPPALLEKFRQELPPGSESPARISPHVSAEAGYWLAKYDKHQYTIWEDKGKLNVYRERIGFSAWTEQPWHPFLLEWEVEVMPLKRKYSDLDLDADLPDPLTRNYDSDCITNNYQLAKDAVDLTMKPGQETLVKEANVYSGRSILTPHAQIQLQEQIDDFLQKELLSSFYDANKVNSSERTNDYFEQNRAVIIQWYKNEKSQKHKIIDQILAIDEKLGLNFPVLAQSLGGFNEALLTHKQTLQLPVEDPLGFDDYQPFAAFVKQAIAGNSSVAPQPRNDFNPIRTGILKIRRLRLVDTFGQVQTLSFKKDQVITTDAMTTPGSPHLVVLPPRLAQAARLNFRWLSADRDFIPESNPSNTDGHSVPASPINQGANPVADEVEMNNHPATTPICGWLLLNNLDKSLMVYNALGQPLGSITEEGQWFPAPGKKAITVGDIPKSNLHLHKLVTHLIHIINHVNHGKDFLDCFLTVVENALDNIDPENAAQYESIALLMGRPVAVVRARLDLDLQGLPAFDQSWNIFRQEVELECLDLNQSTSLRKMRKPGTQNNLRETENFTQVTFPIRLGEYRQLNDGLIGFWKEEEKNAVFHYKEDTFYIAHTGKGERPQSSHPNIRYYSDAPVVLQSIDSGPEILTMLVDPRGSVHATSGILPTKSIHIPADQFAEALRNIEVTFLSAPILTDRGSLNLPLPDEPGYVWSWIDKKNGAWHTETKIGTVNPQAAFTARQEIKEGWLKLSQDEGSNTDG